MISHVGHTHIKQVGLHRQKWYRCYVVWRMDRHETIPSDIIYGGYNSETSVLRLSLMIRLKQSWHTQDHMYTLLWC